MIRNHLSYVSHMQIIDTCLRAVAPCSRSVPTRARNTILKNTRRERSTSDSPRAHNLKMSTTHMTFPALLMLLYCKCMMIACLIIWSSLVYVVCVLDILKEKLNCLTLNEMVWGFGGASWEIQFKIFMNYTFSFYFNSTLHCFLKC